MSGIFSGPTALGIGCVGCGEAASEIPQIDLTVPEGEPKAWWQEEIKTTPWWQDTPSLLKPVQEKPWYLPETQPVNTMAALQPDVSVEAGKLLLPVLILGAAVGAYFIFR